MSHKKETEWPSWLVLVAAVVIAFGLWVGWLLLGLRIVHAAIADYAVHYVQEPNPAETGKPQIPLRTPQREAAGGSTSPSRGEVMAELGQAGDAFGAANALFAALAGALVLWAGVLQARALKEARRATQLATDAFKEERLASKREHFASTFFQMLTLNRQLVERIERGGAYADRQGAAALDSLAASLSKRLDTSRPDSESVEEQASRIATTYVGHIYDEFPSSLGPYFRLLFQTFSFVAEAEIEEQERIRFANIARGQISEGAVMLLAANGLTERGHRFIPLIERFGLLEHLHPEYRRHYKPALLVGYRPSAFMGSKERASQPLFAEPKHPPWHFMTWPDADREPPKRELPH